jgi:glycosyltransferase involved in cell wall biosynthesis
MSRREQSTLCFGITRLETMRQPCLLFVGPIMPPKGGVSVHIERLAALMGEDFSVVFLDESRQIKVDVPNVRCLSPFAYLKMIWCADVVHVHSFSGLLKLLHVICARLLFKRVVLTVHSARNNTVFLRLALAVSSWFAHAVVAVSNEVGRSIPRASNIIPAFLPPERDEFSVSAEVANWIAERKAENRFVFASNAYRLERYKSEDLYGLDLVIDAFAHTSVTQRCACIFVVGDPDHEPSLLKAYENRIAQRKMQGVFLLHTRPESFVGVAALADGTIRATSYDGDALSIRESLHLGKLTIASDAAVRPEGTVTFRSRDASSLITTILGEINHSTVVRPPESGAQGYRDLYLGLYAACYRRFID